MRIVIDCANGAPYKVAPMVLEELGAELFKRGVGPNGLNINENCGALHPDNVASAAIEFRADIGIALDGDGDRCILSDENGEIVDGDIILGLCALQMKTEGRLNQNAVVATPMSNYGLEMTLKQNGISMHRAQVGDRYVVELMRAKGLNLGGEQSGHIVFLDQSTTGDGMIAALKVLEAMRRKSQPLSALKKIIHLLPQVKKDVRVSRKEPLEDQKEIISNIRSAESRLRNRGRVFVRYSGTEPIARVMVEGEDFNEIHALSQEIASTISRVLG